MDWEVRPEAMEGYFTTLDGVSPPSSMLLPSRSRVSSVALRPSPGVGAAGRTGAAWAVAGEKHPLGFWPNENDSGGGGSGVFPEFGGSGSDIDAAAAAARARERATAAAATAAAPHVLNRSSDAAGMGGSISSSDRWDNNAREGEAVGGGGGEGAGAGGSNSWGW